MPDFFLAHEFIKVWEGLYSFDAADRGGETIYGVSRKNHPDWPGWAQVDAGDYDMKELEQLAQDLYRLEYWRPLRCEEYPQQRLATIVYQAAVNCGVRRASRWLQRSVSLETKGWIAQDGIVGKKTLESMAKCTSLYVVGDDVLDEQEIHYRKLAEQDATQTKFLKGWINRVNAARKLI